MIRMHCDPPSVIPELSIRKLTWDDFFGNPPPSTDEFLVSVGRKTNKIGSVYQVVSCHMPIRKANAPFRRFTRYVLGVVRLDDWKDKAVQNPKDPGDIYINLPDGKRVQAHTIVWYSRNKKKK